MAGRGLIAAATADCDMVMNALMGMRGLEPTYHAILAGKDIALANKETLVAGGQLIMEAAAKSGVPAAAGGQRAQRDFSVPGGQSEPSD